MASCNLQVALLLYFSCWRCCSLLLLLPLRPSLPVAREACCIDDGFAVSPFYTQLGRGNMYKRHTQAHKPSSASLERGCSDLRQITSQSPNDLKPATQSDQVTRSNLVLALLMRVRGINCHYGPRYKVKFRSVP